MDDLYKYIKHIKKIKSGNGILDIPFDDSVAFSNVLDPDFIEELIITRYFNDISTEICRNSIGVFVPIYKKTCNLDQLFAFFSENKLLLSFYKNLYDIIDKIHGSVETIRVLEKILDLIAQQKEILPDNPHYKFINHKFDLFIYGTINIKDISIYNYKIFNELLKYDNEADILFFYLNFLVIIYLLI